MLTSDFGVSIAASMAWHTGGRVSSGRSGYGRLAIARNRVTVKRSLGWWYILVRNLSTTSMLISGRPAVSAGPQPYIAAVERSRISDAPLASQHSCDDTIWCRFNRFQMKGPPIQKPSTKNLSTQVIHQAEVVIGVGITAVDLERAGGLPPLALRRSAKMQRYSPLNSSIALEGLRAQTGVVEFSPPVGNEQQREAGTALRSGYERAFS
jgi:hypothetical protein